MVKVVGYHIRKSTKDARLFIVLDLQGDVELVQSMDTGKFYATVRKTTIASTLNEETAKALIGAKYPGSIIRVQSEAYDYVIPDTGEVIKLSHSYVYSPEETAVSTQSLSIEKMVG